ncbi:MAG: S-adenosylmethionine decarboxylase [Candidatus Omnitrophica bacterium]|nr:S-adenosylmethionine decarboxylase [Candidatus Omnitrophota bacterium]
MKTNTSGPEVQVARRCSSGAAKAVKDQVWGIASSFDIYDCNPSTIRDAEKIREFVVQLCELIEMKRFGETQVVHFGEDEKVAGFSMVQLIETSLISAHFANLTNTVYLDVFSCKPYDIQIVERFAQSFFSGSHCITHSNYRY